MLGVLPLEIYDLIADHLQKGWRNDWQNRDWITWAGVCRLFCQDIQQRISTKIRIDISDDDQDVFNLRHLQLLFTGPAPLIDTSKTKEFIISDNRFDTIWDPIGDELRCWDLCHEGVYGDSFLKSLPGGKKIEDPTEEQCERAWKLAIEIFCNLCSNMLNLEVLDWGATVPLTDAYDGPMPLCGALPGSKTIAAQWMKFRKLKVLKLNDRQITDPRFLLYMDTPDLELLEFGSRLYGGSAGVRGGIEYARMTEHQIKEIDLFAEVEVKMNQELYTFMRKCKKLKRVKVESFGPLQNADCLPFWSVVDIEIQYWDLKIRPPHFYQGNEFEKRQYEVARAVRSLKPHLQRNRSEGSLERLSLDDLHRVLRTQIEEDIEGTVYNIDLFTPFREWIRIDRALADRIVRLFNDYRHLATD